MLKKHLSLRSYPENHQHIFCESENHSLYQSHRPFSQGGSFFIGGPRGGVSLIFPKVPQSSQTESLGFPSYPLPLDTLGPLRTL